MRTPWARLAPEAKVVGTVALASVAVGTPPVAWPALALQAGLVVALLASTGRRLAWILGRFSIEVPFLLFAALLPFVAVGERVPLGPVMVSREGLVAAGLLAARSAIAVGAAVALSATTASGDLVDALARLRLPATMVVVIGLMVRYLDVVVGDLRRMSVARASRGDPARLLGRWVVAASGAGRLFVRSYERGERVHLAMVSRGYDATLPRERLAATPARDWAVALAPAAVGLTVVAALVLAAPR